MIEAEANLAAPKSKTPQYVRTEGFLERAWRLPTFTRVIRTIIGVESFHGPVRDGKGWFQLAMVTRHERCVALGLLANATNRDVVRL